jgi:hypothetical protein
MTILTDPTRLAQLVAAQQENYPIIAWANQADVATLGGTSVLTDGDRANAIQGTTYSYWLPDVTTTAARLTFQFPTARTISCAAIAAHNAGTLGATVAVRRSTDGGVTYNDAGAGAAVPTDDSPILWRMLTSGNDATHWEFRFTNLTIGDPLYVAVAFMGSVISVPTKIYAGFAPVVRPTEVALQSNVSVGGNLLGSSVISSGSRMSAQFNLVDQAFGRGNLRQFMPHFNAGKGFFFGWRPNDHADDVHYCWREGEALRFTNMGVLDMIQFGLNMRVYEP